MHIVDVRLYFGVGFDWVLRRNDTRNEDLDGAFVITDPLEVVCRVERVGVTGLWEGEGEAWRRDGDEVTATAEERRGYRKAIRGTSVG